LLDAEGRAIPVQTMPLAHWSDGSIKWLLTDFVLGPHTSRSCTWEIRQAVASVDGRGLERLCVQESSTALEIATGPLRFQWPHVARSFFPRVVLEGQDFLDRAATCLRLCDAEGRSGRAKVRAIGLETIGPL